MTIPDGLFRVSSEAIEVLSSVFECTKVVTSPADIVVNQKERRGVGMFKMMNTLHAHSSDCIVLTITHVQTSIIRIDAYSMWPGEGGFRTFTILKSFFSRACKSRDYLYSYNMRKRSKEGEMEARREKKDKMFRPALAKRQDWELARSMDCMMEGMSEVAVGIV